MCCRLIAIWFLVFGLTGIGRASGLVLVPQAAEQFVPVVEAFYGQTGSDAEIASRLLAMQGSPIESSHRIGQTYEEVWIRLQFDNPADEEIRRVLYLPNHFSAKRLDFFHYSEGRLIKAENYVPDEPRSDDVIIGRSIHSDFAVPPRSSLVILVKAKTGYEQLNQNFHIATRQHFMNWELSSVFFVGIFLGILFLTMLSNVMQAMAYQDRTFLWYSGYCASILLISLSYYGVWVRLFFKWEIQMYGAYVGGFVTLLTGIFFMRPLLDTKKLAPRLDKLLLIVPLLALVALILRWIPETAGEGFALQNVNAILFVLLTCVAGVNAMLHGKELAWLYTAAFLFIALTVTYVRLSHMNIVPISPSAFYAPAVGHIMQIILISYVMFVRTRAAYSEMLQSQRNHSMNERLNLLLKIISHDIANPLQAISLYCNMAQSKVKAEHLPHHELEKAQEAIHSQMRIIRHAKEAVRQMQIGQKLQIMPVQVSQIIQEVLQVFQPLCHSRGILLEVVNELREDLLIYTDPTVLVHNIFGNILSNSIKFTPREGLIRIRIRCLNRRLIVDVIDTGPGMSKDKRMEIFTLNVGKGFNEQLTGAGSFGLSILQMCSEILNGQLDIGPSTVTPEGQELGLRITVSLPLHHSL